MAAKTEGVKNALAQRANGNKPKTVYDLIEDMKPQIARALPKHITPDRIARVALTTIRTTPKLQECNVQSVLAAVMLSAQLGLEPGPLGHSWIVPYGKEATFIIGYRGYLELFWRSGRINSIAVHEVCEHDDFEFEYGLEEKLRHKPTLTERGSPIAYYLVAHYKDGGHFCYVMSKDDIEKIRRRSRAAGNGPWQTDYDAMARKTVVRQAARWMPMSVEMQQALTQDETSHAEIREDLLDTPGDPSVVETEGQTVDEQTGEIIDAISPGEKAAIEAAEREEAGQRG